MFRTPPVCVSLVSVCMMETNSLRTVDPVQIILSATAVKLLKPVSAERVLVSMKLGSATRRMIAGEWPSAKKLIVDALHIIPVSPMIAMKCLTASMVPMTVTTIMDSLAIAHKMFVRLFIVRQLL